MRQRRMKLTRLCGIELYPIKLFYLFATICSVLSSCINNIPEDDTPEPGEIPISLSTLLKTMGETTDNGFEDKDAIGMYIVVQPATIEKTRYVDNMQFTYSASSGFSPKETVFFPEGNNKCDFIGYYPYQANAVSKGESKITIEVEEDQSSKASFSSSDFLVAAKSGVVTSEEPVKLTFLHKLFRINIRLKAQSGYTLDMLQEANPTVKIKDVYTKATYDLNTSEFTNLTNKSDIIPYGEWKIEDDVLCGKSAMIIPQTIPQSQTMIEVYVGDRLFEGEFGEEYELTAGIAENNTVSLYSSNDAIKTTITTSIGDWTERNSSMQAYEASTAIKTTELDFTSAKNSMVYKVINKEEQVAEICLEYLCNSQIKKQALVIYPTKDGKTDLTKGTILEVKDESEDKHGGTVAWDVANNTFTYTEGTSEIISAIYVTPNGEVKTIRPENALQLQLKPDMLVDNRTIDAQEYPIVKIGTQYWMRGNSFKVTTYTDGTDIAHGGSTDASRKPTASNTTPQYYDVQNTYFYYNAACVATGKLIHPGWRIGAESDYDILKTYIQDDASVLKKLTSWNSANTQPLSDLTGFMAFAAGYYKGLHTLNTRTAAFWCAKDNSPNTVNKMFSLSIDNNKTSISNVTITDAALMIRCIRD